jgi:hypothetical protein
MFSEDLVDGQLVIGDQVVTVDDSDIARLILQPNLISNGHYSNVYHFEKNGIKMAVKVSSVYNLINYKQQFSRK